MLIGNLVVWALMGIIVSVGTRILDEKAVKGGMVLSIILGVIGAAIFGLVTKVFIRTSFSVFSFSSLFFSFLGAVIFVNLQRFLPESGNENETEHEMSTQPTPV